jgi:hypothetical protein
MPAQAAIFNIAREGDSNPPRLGRGDTRGSTEARDHFIEAPVAEQTTGIRLLNGTTQVQFLPGANCRSGGYAECAPRFSVSAFARSIPLNAQSVRPAC